MPLRRACGDNAAMPLQNRVTPTGEIVADPARGTLMGNRGCLHTPDRRLGAARWRSKLWICCLLDFKGVRRDPMPPGRWTALFFLDEATAFASCLIWLPAQAAAVLALAPARRSNGSSEPRPAPGITSWA